NLSSATYNNITKNHDIPSYTKIDNNTKLDFNISNNNHSSQSHTTNILKSPDLFPTQKSIPTPNYISPSDNNEYSSMPLFSKAPAPTFDNPISNFFTSNYSHNEFSQNPIAMPTYKIFKNNNYTSSYQNINPDQPQLQPQNHNSNQLKLFLNINSSQSQAQDSSNNQHQLQSTDSNQPQTHLQGIVHNQLLPQDTNKILSQQIDQSQHLNLIQKADLNEFFNFTKNLIENQHQNQNANHTLPNSLSSNNENFASSWEDSCVMFGDASLYTPLNAFMFSDSSTNLASFSSNKNLLHVPSSTNLSSSKNLSSNVYTSSSITNDKPNPLKNQISPNSSSTSQESSASSSGDEHSMNINGFRSTLMNIDSTLDGEEIANAFFIDPAIASSLAGNSNENNNFTKFLTNKFNNGNSESNFGLSDVSSGPFNYDSIFNIENKNQDNVSKISKNLSSEFSLDTELPMNSLFLEKNVYNSNTTNGSNSLSKDNLPEIQTSSTSSSSLPQNSENNHLISKTKNLGLSSADIDKYPSFFNNNEFLQSFMPEFKNPSKPNTFIDGDNIFAMNSFIPMNITSVSGSMSLNTHIDTSANSNRNRKFSLNDCSQSSSNSDACNSPKPSSEKSSSPSVTKESFSKRDTPVSSPSTNISSKLSENPIKRFNTAPIASNSEQGNQQDVKDDHPNKKHKVTANIQQTPIKMDKPSQILPNLQPSSKKSEIPIAINSNSATTKSIFSIGGGQFSNSVRSGECNDIFPAFKTQCSNCEAWKTPLWRRDPEGKPLCNACGLFFKLHGVSRPLSLKTNVIKKRNRASSALIAATASSADSTTNSNNSSSTGLATGSGNSSNSGSSDNVSKQPLKAESTEPVSDKKRLKL
ncbi:Nitrogen regulatory protein areA, partial [Smittium culicis]